jgi:hypothetical protein
MMNRSRIVALLAFTAAFTAIVSVPAHAQKPALVQNIDEKGRNPYQQSIQFTPTSIATGSTPCFTGQNTCEIFFKPVPAGYRLVVSQVTAAYAAAVAGDIGHLAVLSTVTSTTTPVVGDIYVLPSPAVSAGIYTLSVPVTFYVEPGLTPFLDLTNVQFGNNTVTVSISGYLVALNE